MAPERNEAKICALMQEPDTSCCHGTSLPDVGGANDSVTPSTKVCQPKQLPNPRTEEWLAQYSGGLFPERETKIACWPTVWVQ